MLETADHRLFIVGNPDPVHVGAHLLNAARELKIPVNFYDSSTAYHAPWLVAKINWRLRGRRPSRLDAFSRHIVEECKKLKPRWMVTTGISPVADWAMKEIARSGTQLLNFLTDDPWNKAHYAGWFMKSLPLYHHVFSPRRANIPDLERMGGAQISYLPFAYAPELHFADPPSSNIEKEKFQSDTVFAGGADQDRIHYISALIGAGLNVALYGGYWTRYSETAPYCRGYADPHTLRKAVGGASIALCLVRQANRDGHSMRTFEVPAIGACMLVEETDEHREIFGEEGESVLYFNSLEQMTEKAQWLTRQKDECRRLAAASYALINKGNHTYKDRLRTMLLKADGDEKA
jgi:spore maturation protein CgeB